MKTRKFYLLMMGLSIMILSACKKEDNENLSSTLTAFAGIDQNVFVGSTAHLNGYGSSDSEGNPFEYAWEFLEIPQNSTAEIQNASDADPTFIPDVSGKYVVQLKTFHSSESFDTVVVGAFSVTEIEGTYEPQMPGTDVGIRVFRTVCDTLYATCEFSTIGGISALKIAGYDGTSWFPLGCGLEEGSVYDMIDYNCQLYVAGQFDEIGCTPAKNIARWDGNEWHEVGGGLSGGDDPFGYSLEIFNGELYVGGEFEFAGDVPVSNLASWDGEKWKAAGVFEEGSVREMEIYNNQLYVGGYFEKVEGMTAEGLAIFDGSNWSHLGNMGNLTLQWTGWVRDMEVYQDLLYLSGEFYVSGDYVSELITWDGSGFKDFGRAFSLFQNYINELKAIDNILYIGGTLNYVANSESNNVMQWDGSHWGHLSNGVDGTVLTIEAFRNDIYIGGEFNSVGGIAAENITIWSGN